MKSNMLEKNAKTLSKVDAKIPIKFFFHHSTALP